MKKLLWTECIVYTRTKDGSILHLFYARHPSAASPVTNTATAAAVAEIERAAGAELQASCEQ